MLKTYISNKAQKGKPSNIEGVGLFAIASIKKDEVVAVKAGHTLSLNEVKSLSFTCHPELQIADDLFICPSNSEELADSMLYINTSCNPNIGMRGDIVFVAMRDIVAGEELVMDYAMIDNYDYSFECTCGSKECRKYVTGYDWKNINLQQKYGKYFSAYIQSLILQSA